MHWIGITKGIITSFVNKGGGDETQTGFAAEGFLFAEQKPSAMHSGQRKRGFQKASLLPSVRFSGSTKILERKNRESKEAVKYLTGN